MFIPENFAEGDIDDIPFRQAVEQAYIGKSKISIEQTLQLSGSSPEIIEMYADRIMATGAKLRAQAKRPQRIISWLLIIGGVLATIATLFLGRRVFYATIIVSAIGVGWLVKLKD